MLADSIRRVRDREWVRDKDGNEFAFFVPKDEGVEQRACTFVDESKYDMLTLRLPTTKPLRLKNPLRLTAPRSKQS